MSALDFTHQLASRPGGSGADIKAQVGFCRLGVREAGRWGCPVGKLGMLQCFSVCFSHTDSPQSPGSADQVFLLKEQRELPFV